MKKIIMFLVLLLSVFTFAQTTKIDYTCPMHPEVILDKAGKCPKCGMDLVEKENHNHTVAENQTEKKTGLKRNSENGKVTFGGKTVRYDLYVKDTIVNFTGKNRRAIALTVSFRLLLYTLLKGILQKFIFTIC